MIRRAGLLILLSLFVVSCGRQPAPKPDISQPPPRPYIVFMTDFGAANDSVAICKAIIASIAPGAQITDITHQVTPFSIEEGARFLAAVSAYYPPGTVFLAVVDPGVGTSRKALIVKTKKGQYFVLPDNGLITPVLERDGLDAAREITNEHWMIQAPLSSTFHGRDVFSPAQAFRHRRKGHHRRGHRPRRSLRLSHHGHPCRRIPQARLRALRQSPSP